MEEKKNLTILDNIKDEIDFFDKLEGLIKIDTKTLIKKILDEEISRIRKELISIM